MDCASQYRNPDQSCLRSAVARLLFVAQLIVSLIALPLLLIIGFISFAFRACAGEGKDALNELGYVLKEHILVAIPTSAAGIFVSLETSISIFEARTAAFERSEEDPDYETLSQRAFQLRTYSYY